MVSVQDRSVVKISSSWVEEVQNQTPFIFSEKEILARYYLYSSRLSVAARGFSESEIANSIALSSKARTSSLVLPGLSFQA